VGSGHVRGVPGALVVGCDPDGMWWAVDAVLGSYGGSRKRAEAIAVAINAMVTGHWRRLPRIIVQYRYGGTAFVITRVRGAKATPQWEQDAVP